MEGIVKSKLSFVTKNLICPAQHGFVKGRSAVSNLAVRTKFCYESLSQLSQVDVIYTDFAKAFDKVSHKILLEKLNAIGFHSNFLSWLKSYLDERKCYVHVNGSNSSPFYATSGVPQGSILGPLLFTFFVNDIGIKFHYCHHLLYADDLKLYLTVNSAHDMDLLQSDLNSLFTWCNENQLFLNVDKCFVMSFNKSKVKIPTKYYINKTELCKVKQFSDLGVMFDSKLTFAYHLNYILPKAYKTLGFIRRHGRNFKDSYTLKVLYTAFVRSKLEYAAVIWNPFYSVHSNRIERVQRIFTKIALRPVFKLSTLPSYHARHLLLGFKPLFID